MRQELKIQHSRSVLVLLLIHSSATLTSSRRKSKGWEIGLSHSFSDRLGFDATYFSEELEDEINGFFCDAGLSGFTAINLDGISDRKGVELSFWAQLFKSLDLKGSYTYVDAKEPDETGKLREIRRPKMLPA